MTTIEAPIPPSLPTSPPDEHGLGELWTGRQFELSEEEITERTRVSFQKDDQWSEVTRQMIKNSCAFFAQEILSGPPEAPYNGQFLISEHHEEWDDLIMDHRRLMVEAPRDHGKTFFFDFAYPIWKLVTQPGSCGFIFSATIDQAKRILSDIKQELESNPKLQYLMPRRRNGARWSSTVIQCTNGAIIYARGFGTKVRGAHPHWIVVDDGLNDETAYSELVRKKQIEYYYSAITNMVVPGGQIIVVGTPFHAADLYADLADNIEYEFKKYPARQRREGKIYSLWPDRYSLKSLEAKEREIGATRFTREFMCEPISDDMSLFPLYLFKGVPVEQPTLTLGMPKKFWDALGITIFVGVDFALSSSVKADYTVIWVMGLDNVGNRWVIDIIRGKGIPYQQQLSKMNEIGRKYDPALMFLEANQAQRIFGDELIRTTDLPIKLFTTGVQKNALDKGVPSLRVLLENKKFRIPRGDQRSVEMTGLWINEMRAMTFKEGKVVSVEDHDDLAMACWICDQAIRSGGFSYDFGDDIDIAGQSLEELLDELTSHEDEEAKDNGSTEIKVKGNGNKINDEDSGASGNLIGDDDDDFDDPLSVHKVASLTDLPEIGEWY